MQKEITPTATPEGDIFEFSFIYSRNNFSFNQRRSTMSVIIILPRGAQLHGKPLAISPEDNLSLTDNIQNKISLQSDGNSRIKLYVFA